MHFFDVPNAALSLENDRPLMQKEVYRVSENLQQYLTQFGFSQALPLHYQELLQYDYTNSLKDELGKHTHWERVVYKKESWEILEEKLKILYQLLVPQSVKLDLVKVIAVDFCEFANSMPFRIHVEWQHEQDKSNICYYIKQADASRVVGLLLETWLTNNPIGFLYDDQTLVETHIEGEPGDECIKGIDQWSELQKKELATAFVRFNINCFARLLGDMRSYNFVVVKTDSKSEPIKIRAIDFDQQCYEGRVQLYLPQFYKENLGYVNLVKKLLGREQTESIVTQARQEMRNIALSNAAPLKCLLHMLEKEELSENYKIASLSKELNSWHRIQQFDHFDSMGAIVKQQLELMLQY